MSSNTKLTLQQSRRLRGEALTRIDREQKMLESGRLGTPRLVINVALDFQEKYPNMTWNEAVFAALGYVDRTFGG